MSAIIAVALITGTAAIIPQFLSFWHGLRLARKAEQSQHANTVRRALEHFYSVVCDLQTQIRVNNDYHGDEMRERLEQIWRYAGQAEKLAMRIELLAGQPDLAHSARALANAVARAALEAEARTDLDLKRFTGMPDLNDLIKYSKKFLELAVSYRSG
jgi:hypothetical protein